MNIKQNLKIDLMLKQNTPRVYAVQNDANTRSVELNLFSGGFPWVVPDGVSISVAYRKPDKTSGWYDKLPDGSDAYSVDGNAVTITFAPQVLTVPGTVKASVVFQDSETLDRIATFPMEIYVEEDPAAGKSLSNNYYNYQTLGDINAAIDATKAYYINIVEDDEGNLVADKLFDDIRTHYHKGASLCANYNGIILPIRVDYSSDRSYVFEGTVNDNEHYRFTVYGDQSVDGVIKVLATEKMLDGKIDIFWGEENKGKALVIGDDGRVQAKEQPEAGGEGSSTTVADGSITTEKLADGAVTVKKTDFITLDGTSANLFNKATVTDGKQIYQSAPYNQLLDSSTGCVSDFIPVEANTMYCRSANSFEATGTVVAYQCTFFYDYAKNGLSFVRHCHKNNSFTTPENCAYIRINLPMDCKDIAMVVKGNAEPSKYVPYMEYYKLGDSIRIGVDNIESLYAIFEAMPDGIITKEKLSNEVSDEIESVDSRINTAAGWNDVRQPTKKLTGRINVFEKAVKGVFDITSDISDKTVVVHGVNYFDKNDLIPGKINNSNGTISNSTTDYYTSRLIPVQPGKMLFYNRDKDSSKSYLVIHYYDVNQNWLRIKAVGGITAAQTFTPEDDVYYIRVACGSLIDADAEKLCIADVDIGATHYGGYEGNISIESTGGGKTYFGKNVHFPYIGYRIENGVLVGASDAFTVEEITHVDVFDSASTIEVTAPVEAFDKERLSNVVLKYGRHGDTDYVMARIFKNTITGESITPRVLAFTPGGKKMSALTDENDFVMAINAGVFNTDDNSCIGVVISDGEVVADHIDHMYSRSADVLGIDASGNLASYEYAMTTGDMLAAGVVGAVSGKNTLIENYAKYDLDLAGELLEDTTLCTTKHPRTAIGQYKNGDYMVFTCGGRETNQAGMTCAEMQELFVAEGVKYAYNLDGGGSCNMMFFKKELAPYTENRADPTYIVFN